VKLRNEIYVITIRLTSHIRYVMSWTSELFCFDAPVSIPWNTVFKPCT